MRIKNLNSFVTMKVQASVIVVGGIFLGTALYQLPAEQCVLEQTALLVSGPYAEIPERAENTARVLCNRNGNHAQSIFMTID